EITLYLAAVSSKTEVTASKQEVAEAQMKSEVEQRLLGFLPNYYVVYFKDPVPLNAGQKMRLAFRLSIDPVTFGLAAVQAAVETNSKDFEAYGTGAEGFAKRYAAAYADGFIGTMVASGLLHAVLRQDPRYYYKGTGTVRSRVLYALSWSFRCKGDDGKWQIAYSSLIGNVASSTISGLYYPNGISASQTVKNSMLNLASQGVDALFQEFLFKRLTTHSKDPGKLP
ncbi:MAG: carboxypeptidase regulatory-like domain-containing protein, partial [Acidobacteriaceae bacterium]|nr:carboxypeptidase regulatory-like domain-containing protein [Acidobacteriaceae bacterium]